MYPKVNILFSCSDIHEIAVFLIIIKQKLWMTENSVFKLGMQSWSNRITQTKPIKHIIAAEDTKLAFENST